jgi:hypothetical protein
LVSAVGIVAGIVGLMYGKFAYPKATHKAELGSLELSIREKRTVRMLPEARGEQQ